MSLPRYEKYKDSGVEWIGEIPEGWEVKRLKFVVSKVGSGVTPKGGANVYQLDGIPLLRSQNIHFDALKLDDVAYISQEIHDEMQNSKVMAGDVLLNITGASIGRCYFSDGSLEDANVNQHVCIIRPTSEIGTKYLYYLLRSDIGQKQIDVDQTGSGREGLNFEVLKNFLLPLADNSEQTAIASFLDRKTAEIDQLIANKEKLIALYEEEKTTIINHAVTKGLDPKVKTKPSGVEWLGGIAEHWKMKKLKFLLKENRGALKTGPFGSQLKTSDMSASGQYKVYTQRNVLDNDYLKGDDRIDDDKFNSLKEFEVFVGDILITTRGTIGKCAIFPERAVKGVLHPCLIRIQIDNDIMLSKYIINYFNNSSFFLENVKLESNSTVIDVIYGYTLKEIVIPLPPVTEQIAIVAHIETECSRLDAIIDKFKKQIELFKEYRTTLISEVVTGKIDVCDEVAA